MSVIVKFEKEIDSCLSCPFHDEHKAGSDISRCGEYVVLKCTKLKRNIKTYDNDDYFVAGFTVEIPTDCPFNTK